MFYSFMNVFWLGLASPAGIIVMERMPDIFSHHVGYGSPPILPIAGYHGLLAVVKPHGADLQTPC